MAAEPSNFFQKLAGVPVLYDRLHDHYGRTGIPYKFHPTPKVQGALNGLFNDLF